MQIRTLGILQKALRAHWLCRRGADEKATITVEGTNGSATMNNKLHKTRQVFKNNACYTFNRPIKLLK